MIGRSPRRGLAIAVALCTLGLAGCTATYTGGARPVTSTLDAGWLRAAPTPVVRQRAEADCGLAALAMIGARWGQRWSIEELATDAPPSARGIKLARLRDVARSRGLEAYAIKGAPADLAHELERGRPVMIGLLRRYSGNRGLRHYEVAIAFDPRTRKLVTIDPASGARLERSAQSLDEEWKAAGYATLVVLGPHSRP